jgi:ectoine hydroxylase-related dioxygenase (phytanoyl-CoA dioxygenase family)
MKVDNDGFAVGLCPFTEADLVVSTFNDLGYVVIANVVTQNELECVKYRVDYLLDTYSEAVDSNSTPILSRGFFEIYYDISLDLIRGSARFYEAHKLIWNRVDLWVTFDRFVVKKPNTQGLPLHLDQNPYLQSGFDCTQGLVSIANNTSTSGSTLLVPKSHRNFELARNFCNQTDNYNSVPIDSEYFGSIKDNVYNIHLRDGDGLIWDSRTIHGSSDNLSDQTRIAALVSYQPQTNEAARLKRVSAFRNRDAFNDRDARMHASIRPRFTDPDLVRQLYWKKEAKLPDFIKLLYGLKEYQ